MKVVYGKSKHPQRSAPAQVPPTALGQILRLEELMCEQRPEAVNSFLIREHWGSGHLKGCSAEGSAIFVEKSLWISPSHLPEVEMSQLRAAETPPVADLEPRPSVRVPRGSRAGRRSHVEAGEDAGTGGRQVKQKEIIGKFDFY
eukprot:Skav204162  [mRNA]  locus=scaffold903:337440:338019:+ [translate_table: standard]